MLKLTYTKGFGAWKTVFTPNKKTLNESYLMEATGTGAQPNPSRPKIDAETYLRGWADGMNKGACNPDLEKCQMLIQMCQGRGWKIRSWKSIMTKDGEVFEMWKGRKQITGAYTLEHLVERAWQTEEDEKRKGKNKKGD